MKKNQICKLLQTWKKTIDNTYYGNSSIFPVQELKREKALKCNACMK